MSTAAESLICVQCAQDTGFVSSRVGHYTGLLWPVCSAACFRSILAQKALMGYVMSTPSTDIRIFMMELGADAYTALRDADGVLYAALLYES